MRDGWPFGSFYPDGPESYAIPYLGVSIESDCKPLVRYSGNYPNSNYGLLPIDGSIDHGKLFVSLKDIVRTSPRGSR